MSKLTRNPTQPEALRAKTQQLAKEFRWSNRNIFAILQENKILSNSSAVPPARLGVRGGNTGENTVQVLSYQSSFLFTRNEISASDKVGRNEVYAWLRVIQSSSRMKNIWVLREVK